MGYIKKKDFFRRRRSRNKVFVGELVNGLGNIKDQDVNKNLVIAILNSEYFSRKKKNKIHLDKSISFLNINEKICRQKKDKMFLINISIILLITK